MNQPLEILGSAQPFGFGGITEVAALEGAFRLDPRGKDACIYLIRNSQFDAVIKDVRSRFHLLIEQDSNLSHLETLLHTPKLMQVDAVVSSYDTASVLYGWYKDIPTYFYDGMAWFWDIDGFKNSIETIIEYLRIIKTRKDEVALITTYKKLASNDYHSTVLLAYHLADRVYARNGHNVAERISRLPNLFNKAKVIGAMIDPSYVGYKSLTKEHILVSLSGSLAPTLSYEDNLLFMRGALSFAKEAYNESDLSLPWIFCCHPSLFQSLSAEGRLNNLPDNFFVKPSMSYLENLQTISKAYALFVSPGFSSIQEAALFRTPVFFLPEQNGGQPTGFTNLKKANYPTEHNLTITDHIHNGALNIKEYETRELYKGVSKLWSDEMLSVRQSIVRTFFNILSNPESREHLITNQHNAVERLMGGFDGAITAATDILNHLTV